MDSTFAANQPKLPFKQRVSFEERKAFAIQLRQKKPHYVPLVVENDGTSNAIELKKDRFFIPEDSKVSDFIKVIVDKYIEADGEMPISTVSVKIQTPSKAIQPSNGRTRAPLTRRGDDRLALRDVPGGGRLPVLHCLSRVCLWMLIGCFLLRRDPIIIAAGARPADMRRPVGWCLPLRISITPSFV